MKMSRSEVAHKIVPVIEDITQCYRFVRSM